MRSQEGKHVFGGKSTTNDTLAKLLWQFSKLILYIFVVVQWNAIQVSALLIMK